MIEDGVDAMKKVARIFACATANSSKIHPKDEGEVMDNNTIS